MSSLTSSPRSILLLLLVLTATSAAYASSMCNTSATYRVSFVNTLTPARFGDAIPPTGLVYSPLTAVSHSNRASLLTVRGYARPAIAAVAKTGDNGPLLRLTSRLQKDGLVADVTSSMGPTMPGNATRLTLRVPCDHSFITVVSMIAPSPDWIVQVSNVNVYTDNGFEDMIKGDLIAYDAGVDDGNQFTPPGDASLDLPTMPRMNIAPLSEDTTDRFNGRHVGRYNIKRID